MLHLSRAALALVACATPLLAAVAAEPDVRTGAAAFGGWKEDAPGVRRLITPADLPAPYATRSASNGPGIVDRPPDAAPKTLPGFAIEEIARGLDGPRQVATSPNGDILITEMEGGTVRVLRLADGKVERSAVFARGLDEPFGLALYPPGRDPRWLYVANTDSVVRFPYTPGDLEARGPAETVVPRLPAGGHATRGLAFTPDGSRMLVSVGSASNVFQGAETPPAAEIRDLERERGPGALWGSEAWRADVLSFAPDGSDRRVYATGLRNCVTLTIQPATGQPWCVVNERDGLGDNLVPDYATRVQQGAFYGWPWYYIGANQDPRHKGERPDLRDRITVPDVLFEAHSATLGLTFYDGDQFPPEYRGDAFVAMHGSWNRGVRTGYKVVRVPMRDGRPTGVYEDFVTGFVVSDANVWARPVGVGVARDGSLILTEDGNGTVWRITFRGERRQATR
jgi:glucose/arabinose dehydrogenase